MHLRPRTFPGVVEDPAWYASCRSSVIALSLLSFQVIRRFPITMTRRRMQSVRLTTDRMSTADFWHMLLFFEGDVPSGQTLHVTPFPMLFSGHSVQRYSSQKDPSRHEVQFPD